MDPSTVTTWRIVSAKRATEAFDGLGAKRHGGRWNRPGTAMVYTAGSLALAMLEMLVHLEDEMLLAAYVAIPAQLPSTIIAALPPRELPQNWRADPVPSSTMSTGSAWAEEMRCAVLEVPSTIVPQESNYLLNPLHPDFGEIGIGAPQPFDFDHRLGS